MIYGLDNALVDILLRITDDELETYGLKKGVINFPPETVRQQLKGLDAEKVSPGGCAANTLSLLSQLGAGTVMLGKVGDDDNGRMFVEQLEDDGVKSALVREAGETGTAITLITPDAERTFALHLGLANQLRPDELPDVQGMLYLTTFFLTDPACGETALAAIRMADEVVLDLSDPTVVEPNRDELLKVLEEDVDIVFANDSEAEALTGKTGDAACHDLAELCKIAIVKVGEDGSYIREDGKVVHVPAHVVTAIDTTGAGDAYAAGFLYGYVNDWPLEKAGRLGSLLAAEVIRQVGARLERLPDNVKEFL